VDARIAPEGTLEVLSRSEVAQLRDAGQSGLQALWRQCSLAVLNAGTEEDDVTKILSRNRDFQMSVVQQEGGIAIDVKNAPDSAFVNGKMIRGVRDHLFAVLRDLLYAHGEIEHSDRFDLNESSGVTDAVFHILRNAHVLHAGSDRGLVVCWGGHAISREEYDYTKLVGYELGLRGFDICTGCGAGAMKGPMKGAAVGHAKQRITDGRYLGFTEPTIIAAEAPNPIVNELVILPDMEKRLEAFVRTAHALVVFPGGVGTAEELLYLLGILLHPDNADIELPIIMNGPEDSRTYFELLREFIGETLGEAAQSRYRILIDDPAAVANELTRAAEDVETTRRLSGDAYFFNWRLRVSLEFQKQFVATHESMADLALDFDQPVESLAVNLRRAFSGIVAGNVREAGIRLVREKGPFSLSGDARIMRALDRLLEAFVADGRMKLSRSEAYVPCYTIRP
jgi:predicted Rossmann-fold nucleotide-binding protein